MSGRLRVLHVIHDFLPRHRAGSEIYAYRLCQAQSERHHVEVLAAEYDPSREHGSLHRRTFQGLTVHELVNNWHFKRFRDTYLSPALEQNLGALLAERRPDVVHIHNLLNLTFALPGLAKRAGAVTVATLHDYTLVCPSGGQRLHLAEQHVCRRIDPQRCGRCFTQSPFHAQMAFGVLPAPAKLLGPLATVGQRLRPRWPRAVGFAEQALKRWSGKGTLPSEISERLLAARQVFEDVSLFVAPSGSLADEYQRLGLPKEKLLVSDYGFIPLEVTRKRPADERLRLGFVGTLAWHKGVHVLLEAVRMLPRDGYTLTVFGDLATFPAYSQQLRTLASDLPVRFAGAFSEEEAARVYGALDALVVPSLWLENSPLVIHEAFQAGVPVIGARSGGIADLVQHGHNGLLYDSDSPAALTSALTRLLEEPQLLARLREGIPVVKDMKTDAREWEERYHALLKPRAPGKVGS